MKGKLVAQALMKIFLGLLSVALLLFLPAGTVHYPNAWLFMGVLFLPMLVTGSLLLWKSPELLKKRLHSKEREPEQRRVIALSALMFVGGFLVAGLDFRYGWSQLPPWAVWAAAAVLLVSYVLYAEVIRENAYLSRTVEVQEGQKVVDTGLYGLVRHPMYFATLLLFLSMPLVLGSVYALLIFLIYPAILVKRIQNEEAVLKEGLEGYRAYTQKVRWRLIPFLW